MLATILKSKIAAQVTISIVRTFSEMRKLIGSDIIHNEQLRNLEKKQLSYEIKNDEKIEKIEEILKALEDKDLIKEQGIFSDGQIFDSYNFIAELIRSAKKSILLIDNYINDATLMLLSKNQNVEIKIYTKEISNQLNLDLTRYNAQYKQIEVIENNTFHDRFLIIDDNNVYHI